jgi:hypothetical protein
MSAKTRYAPGQLYELINHFGQSDGVCLFLEMIEPGVLTLSEVVRPKHWHMKIMLDGKIVYRDTSITTLIELPLIDYPCDLVNQHSNP